MPYVMSQALIVRRIREAVGTRGHHSKRPPLHRDDMAAFLGVTPGRLDRVAYGKQRLSEEEQVKLSAFIMAFDRGEFERDPMTGDLVRALAPARDGLAASQAGQARATIDWTGGGPRINWSR